MGVRRGLAVLAGAILAVAVGCSDGSPASAGNRSAGTVPEAETAGSETAGSGDGSCPTSAAPASSAVGRRTVTLVDPSRTTPGVPRRGLAERPDRTLPVTVLYPSSGRAGTSASFVDDAPMAEGRHPIVVWSHGVISSGQERNDVLAAIARAGYVVVAPTFPLSSGPEGREITDLSGQAGDVTFLLDQIRGSDGVDGVNWISDHALSDCVALAGHSFGGVTTLAAAFDPCCRPSGLRAVIVVSGAALPVTAGFDWATAPPLPTLIAHGSLDRVVAPTLGERTFDLLRGPRWLVRFPAGDHNSLFVAPLAGVLVPAMVNFLDAELRGSDEDRADLATRGPLGPPVAGAEATQQGRDTA